VESSLIGILSLGFLLGLKHATDGDHVVAVTTFVSRERSLLRSCWIGLFWGIGHTLSLTIAGSLLFLLKFNISERISGWLELGVAMMLVVLGGKVLADAWRAKFYVHRHAHSHAQGKLHTHWHLHGAGRLEEHGGWLHVGLRPLIVGMVHGAAGTGALMLLVLSTIHSPAHALLYMLIFGTGSIAGMLLVSLLLAVPLQWVSTRAPSGYSFIQLSAGFSSCLFGIYLGLAVWQNL
jgi:uncharacterized membrane protein